MTTVYYVPACPGAGKTYAAQEIIANRCRTDQKVLVVQPTVKLIDDTVREMHERFPGISIHKFHNECVSGSVAGALEKYLNNPDIEGHVVFTTTLNFEFLRYFHRKDKWHLVIDEIPNAAPAVELSVADEHRIFTDHVTVEAVGPKYGRLIARNLTALRSLADNRNQDAARELFQPSAKRLLSPHYDNYVILTSYYDLINSRGQDRRLCIYNIMKPSLVEGFASVLLLGARSEETLLFKIWSQLGVTFVKHEGLMAKLKYIEHQNGPLIQFKYGSERDWSQSKANADGSTMLEDLRLEALKAFPNEEFAFLANNRCKQAKELDLLELSERLPAWSHGLNKYQHLNNVIITAAYNPSSSARSFLTDLFDISAEEQRVAMMCHNVYQAFCRSSIRDSNNHHPKIVVLPDRATAEWCQKVFPGSTVSSLGIDKSVVTAKRGRPQIHASSKDRRKASRERIKMDRAVKLDFVDLANIYNINEIKSKDEDVNLLYSKENYVSRFKGTIVGQTDYKPKAMVFADDDEFISYLRARSKITVKSKIDNEQISPAMFDICKSADTNTGNANVVFANGIWLDFDKTDLTPKRLSELFPDLKIYTYETFRSTKDVPRYRAYIPTNSMLTNDDTRFIIKEIKNKIQTHGYPLKIKDPLRPELRCHGLENKYNASDKFYLPCKPKDGRSGTFKAFDKGGRCFLNVEAWLDHPSHCVDHDDTYAAMPTAIPSGDITFEQKALAESALDRFRAAPQGEGYEKFGNLHWFLLFNGITGADYHYYMQQAISCSRSPLERKRDYQRLSRYVRY